MTTAPASVAVKPASDQVGVDSSVVVAPLGLDDGRAIGLERAELEAAGDHGADLAADDLGAQTMPLTETVWPSWQRAGELTRRPAVQVRA